MAKMYSTRPSAILMAEDEYTAYCLDEACAYIAGRIERGDTPTFEVHYSSFSNMYHSLRQEGVE